MNRRRVSAASLLALAVLLLWSAEATRAEPEVTESLPGPFERIRVIDFPYDIEAVLYAYVNRQVTAARQDGVDCIVFRIDSPGGTVYHSEKIGDLLLDLPETLHVVAWVPKGAYSGAAMVSLACDEIVMGRDAHLGDSQPITISPEGIKPVGEKMESPLRAKFRAYAERNGYPVALAEAMVSQRIEVLRVRDPNGNIHFVKGTDFRNAAPEAEIIPGFTRADLVQVGTPAVRKEELLTMTAREASDFGFLRRRFGDGGSFPASEEDLLEALSADGAVVEHRAMSFSERASRILMQIAGILSAIVALAILVFMWQGPGLMTIIGGAALVLLLAINFTADQLHGFPLFLILVGVLLLGVEIFVLPGFGVAGILGVASLTAGFLFLAGGVTLSEPGNLGADLVLDFGLQFVLTAIGGMVLLLIASRYLPSVGPARRIMLSAPGAPTVVEDAAAPPAVQVGQQGIARSALRPAGTAEF
ncbi:MAG: NfeD family protein, partial [Planctomycetota bacterium]